MLIFIIISSVTINNTDINYESYEDHDFFLIGVKV